MIHNTFTDSNTIRTESFIKSASPSEWAENNLLFLQWYGYFSCDERYEVEREYYNSQLIMYTVGGAGKVKTNAGEFVCRPGDIVLIDCREPHSYCTLDRSWEFYWFHFSGSRAYEVSAPFYERQGKLVRLQEASMTYQYIKKVVRNGDAKSREDEIELSAYIQLILCEVIRQNIADTRSNRKSDELESALAYIEEHFSDQLTVEAVADYVGLSKSYFSSMFKKETGFSPYDFIMNKRLNMAKELLKTSHDSVNNIAARVGFNSTANFIQTFRTKYDMTPRQYRNAKIIPSDFVDIYFKKSLYKN